MDRKRAKENKLREIQKTSQLEITYFSRQSFIYALSLTTQTLLKFNLNKFFLTVREDL
jgi:hypothetical protein